MTNVYVRMFKPNSVSDGFPGHYDLKVEGTWTFRNHSFTDPVFSYRLDGTLDVFDGSQSDTVYGINKGSSYANCAQYYHRYTVDDQLIGIVLWNLELYVASTEGEGSFIKCRLNDNCPFRTYDIHYYNCFAAVSVWLEAMRITDLRTFYDTTHETAMAACKPAVLEPNRPASWIRIY